MGLDSVELLVETEKYFDISIPDLEAEQIYTIQDFSDCIYRHIILIAGEKCKSQLLFYKLRLYISDNLSFPFEKFKPNTLLSEFISLENGEKIWQQMQADLDLKFPEFKVSVLGEPVRKEVKFFGMPVFSYNGQVKYPIIESNVRNWIDWILSLNHEKFFDPKQICSKEEVERIVIAITSEKMVIPVNEIKLEHSLTRDLGID